MPGEDANSAGHPLTEDKKALLKDQELHSPTTSHNDSKAASAAHLMEMAQKKAGSNPQQVQQAKAVASKAFESMDSAMSDSLWNCIDNIPCLDQVKHIPHVGKLVHPACLLCQMSLKQCKKYPRDKIRDFEFMTLGNERTILKIKQFRPPQLDGYGAANEQAEKILRRAFEVQTVATAWLNAHGVTTIGLKFPHCGKGTPCDGSFEPYMRLSTEYLLGNGSKDMSAFGLDLEADGFDGFSSRQSAKANELEYARHWTDMVGLKDTSVTVAEIYEGLVSFNQIITREVTGGPALSGCSHEGFYERLTARHEEHTKNIDEAVKALQKFNTEILNPKGVSINLHPNPSYFYPTERYGVIDKGGCLSHRCLMKGKTYITVGQKANQHLGQSPGGGPIINMRLQGANVLLTRPPFYGTDSHALRYSYFLSVTKWNKDTASPIWPPGSLATISYTASPRGAGVRKANWASCKPNFLTCKLVCEESPAFTPKRSDFYKFRTTALAPENPKVVADEGALIDLRNLTDFTTKTVLKVPAAPTPTDMERA